MSLSLRGVIERVDEIALVLDRMAGSPARSYAEPLAESASALRQLDDFHHGEMVLVETREGTFLVPKQIAEKLTSLVTRNAELQQAAQGVAQKPRPTDDLEVPEAVKAAVLMARTQQAGRVLVATAGEARMAGGAVVVRLQVDFHRELVEPRSAMPAE